MVTSVGGNLVAVDLDPETSWLFVGADAIEVSFDSFLDFSLLGFAGLIFATWV